MGTNLFVGNLPYNVTEQDLIEMFSQVGEVVSAQIILDKETRRSRGFGFVRMSNDEEAAAAIQRFHQQQVMGRQLTVNEAKPRTERSGGGGGWGRRERY